MTPDSNQVALWLRVSVHGTIVTNVQKALVEVERGHCGTEAFAPESLLGGMEQRRKQDDVLPQVVVPFHTFLLPSLLSQPPTSYPISSRAFAAKP
jgi:hypothetical protein